MKLTSLPIVVCVLLLAERIQASCTTGDGPCQDGSGVCSAAVITALTGGGLSQAAATLSYGKYCGRFTLCAPVVGANASNPDQCELGTSGCPAAPCNPLDAACQIHDSCLENVIADNSIPRDQLVPIPLRCQCDVNLAAAAFSLVQSGTSLGQLCDAAYYSSTLPGFTFTASQLLRSEAILVAVPFCCTAVAKDSSGNLACQQDAVDKSYGPVLTAVVAACNATLQGFASLGIQVCGAPSTAPPTSAPVHEPCSADDGDDNKKSHKKFRGRNGNN